MLLIWAPQAWAGALPLALIYWKCRKVLVVLQMLSKVSVNEVFMHYFEKISSASGASLPAQTPTEALPLDPCR